MRGEMAAEELEFKMPADGTHLGHASTRVRPPSPRSPAPWTTAQDLGLKMPADTLQLALVQAKVSHANIMGVDTSEAEKMPGVAKVITAQGRQGQEPHHRPDHLPDQQG